MPSGSLEVGSAQFLTQLRDNLGLANGWPQVGKEVANALGDAEGDLMTAYSRLSNLKTTNSDGSSNADEIRRVESEIQVKSILVKKFQTLMDLFQTLIKSKFDMYQKIVQNMSVR